MKKAMIDIDGVLADSDAGIFKRLGPPAKCCYRIGQAYPHVGPERVQSIFRDWRFYWALAPYPGANKGASALVTDGWSLYYTTSRPGWPKSPGLVLRAATWLWLTTRQFPRQHLRFIPSIHKARFVRNAGITLVVENNSKTADACADIPGVLSIALVNPAFPHAASAKKAVIAYSWQDVLRITREEK